MSHSKYVTEIDQKFERLTVINPNAEKYSKNGWRILSSLVECVCGNTLIVTNRRLHIMETLSCGCLQKERASKSAKTHGLSKTRIHRIWSHMKNRCYNPHNKNYDIYGGRGITVCDVWRESFTEFLSWAKSVGYTEEQLNLSIERKNSNGNYEPNNCIFIPMKDQGKNTSKNKPITAFNETKNVAEWSRDSRCNVTPSGLYQRLSMGWQPEKAISKPQRKINKQNKAA